MARKQTVTVSLESEQIEWLDKQDENRSALIRNALSKQYDMNGTVQQDTNGEV